MTSAIAAATPRNGTCSACTPARFSSSSMARCADDPGPPEPKVISPGLLLRQRHQLGERARPEAPGHQQDRGRIGDPADLRQIAHRIIGQVRIEAGEMKRGVGEQKRVAVRRRAHHHRGAGCAAGAAAILDHHRLAELLRELVGDEPRGDIGERARHEGHDDTQHPVRPADLAEGRSDRG